MANSIAKLAVIITANAAGVKTATDAAAGHLNRFGNTVGGLFGGGAAGMLGRVFAPVTSLLTGAITSHVGSLSDKFKDLASSVSQTSKDATRLGLPVEDLMGLQYAAQRSGVDVEQLNKALFHMSRNEGGNVMEGLMEAADKFGKIGEEGGNKAAYAFDKFAKSGFALSSMLAKGSGGIRAMIAEGQALGLVLSAVDIQSLTQANRTLKMMGLTVDGLYNRIVIAMAPAITNVGNMLLAMGPRLGEIAGMAGSMFGDTLEVAVMLLGIILEDLKAMKQPITVLGESLTTVFMDADTAADGFRGTLKFLAKAMGYVWDAAKAGAGAFLLHLGMIQVAVGELGHVLDLQWGQRLALQGAANVLAGKDMVHAFGETAEKIDGVWGAMFKKRRAMGEAVNNGIEAAYHATGAAIEGSREAASIRARFQFESAQAQDPKVAMQRKQLAAEEATAQAAAKIARQIDRVQTLNIF